MKALAPSGRREVSVLFYDRSGCHARSAAGPAFPHYRLFNTWSLMLTLREVRGNGNIQALPLALVWSSHECGGSG